MKLSLTREELRITQMALEDYIDDPWDEQIPGEHQHAMSALQVLRESEQPEEKKQGRYTEPVKFTKTDQYGCGPKDEDDVYTVEEFRESVACNEFIDDDGEGHPVKDRLADTMVWVWPSPVRPGCRWP